MRPRISQRWSARPSALKENRRAGNNDLNPENQCGGGRILFSVRPASRIVRPALNLWRRRIIGSSITRWLFSSSSSLLLLLLLLFLLLLVLLSLWLLMWLWMVAVVTSAYTAKTYILSCMSCRGRRSLILIINNQ